MLPTIAASAFFGKGLNQRGRHGQRRGCGGQKLKRKKMFEGLAPAPPAAPWVTVKKINDTYEEITIHHEPQEEYRKKAD